MKISIIIPVHNCAKYIKQTLDVLNCQTFPKKDLEVIVFCDGCTDDSFFIVSNYKKKNPDMNIKLLKSDKNVGASVARNEALKVATGEYLHFMDADDILNESFYESLYISAKRTNSDVAVSCFYNERYPETSIFFNFDITISCPQDKLDYTKVDSNGYSCRYLIRKSYWDKNNFCYPKDQKYVEDLLLMNKVVFFSNRICLVPDAVYFYKFRQNSMLTRTDDNKRRNEDYKKARLETNMFLSRFDLGKNSSLIDEHDILLFKFFPLLRIASNQYSTKVYLFNFILIFKIIKSKKRK